jgi:chromosomal replication initiation ATPase DnaA
MRTDQQTALQVSRRLAHDWRGLDGDLSERADELLKIVCAVMDEDPLEVAGDRRFCNLVRARFLWWACIRRYMGWSFPAIGTYVDRSHTSVLYGINQVPNSLIESIAPLLSDWHQERAS